MKRFSLILLLCWIFLTASAIAGGSNSNGKSNGDYNYNGQPGSSAGATVWQIIYLFDLKAFIILLCFYFQGGHKKVKVRPWNG